MIHRLVFASLLCRVGLSGWSSRSESELFTTDLQGAVNHNSDAGLFRTSALSSNPSLPLPSLFSVCVSYSAFVTVNLMFALCQIKTRQGGKKC